MNNFSSPGPLSPVQKVKDPENWKPDSWRRFSALQQATYPDYEALEKTLHALGELPPLVTSWEIL